MEEILEYRWGICNDKKEFLRNTAGKIELYSQEYAIGFCIGPLEKLNFKPIKLELRIASNSDDLNI